MKKTIEIGVPIGISLMLMVFVLTCLITFAALSFISSNNDNEMSISTAESSDEYYLAESKAQENLKEIDQVLNEEYNDIGSSYLSSAVTILNENEEYKFEIVDGTNYLSFEVKVDEEESLNVKIEILSPIEGEGFYKIKEWKLVYTGDWEADDSLPVFVE